MRHVTQHLSTIKAGRDIDAAQLFFERVGFTRETDSQGHHRRLRDPFGSQMFLNASASELPYSDRTPFELHAGRGRTGLANEPETSLARY